ncbi:hypothetical protein [Aquabacterium humicola]|uniref:hypothetical protein n=1 Tax=Aquabacterium humicola TaxID=3237377 RepID=UPI002542E8FB|nr:hypothetical protein [Rubrivivax pictus]
MKKTMFARLAALCAFGAGSGLLHAQVSTYDATSGVLTIPSVSVGGTSYTNVTLQGDAQMVFALQGATTQTPAAPGVASYNAATKLLTLPAVKVGELTYVNVTLRDTGQYRFTLQEATPLAADTLAGVKALLAAIDAQFATQVPGAARMQHADACYLHDGRSRDWLMAENDGNPAALQARDAYRIGQQTLNVQVLAVRQLSNADGSTRVEVDVQYDQRFVDGSMDVHVRQTLVTGSTHGTPRCATPQSGSSWRLLGDQRLVSVAVRARNLRTDMFDATRTPPLTTTTFRREVRWLISDPMGHARYAIVTGPLLIGGKVYQRSFKFLSPRVMRSAPEMSGKVGNHLNWRDEDTFRICDVQGNASGTPPSAVAADCAGFGASSDNWGFSSSSPSANADLTFANLGMVPGATYVFAIHDDDGWKTVNGQAARTPIATYTAVLDKLPYSFVQMATAGPQGERHPRLSFGGLSLAQVHANAMSVTPAPMNMSWNAPAAPDGRVYRVLQAHEFFSGPKLGNAAGVLYPGYRHLKLSYPASTATSFSGMPVTPLLADMGGKTTVEFALHYVDRNDNEIAASVTLR